MNKENSRINSREEKVLGNLFFIKGIESFKKGTLDNVNIKEEDNKEFIELESHKGKYKKYGIFTSNIINTEKFNKLIVSWNVKTPKNTYVEIEARVYVSYKNKEEKNICKWSEWLSWGQWGNGIKNSSIVEKKNLVSIDTDIFFINGTADKFQIRAKLYTKNDKETPKLFQLTASYINTNSGEEISKVFNEEVNYDKAYKIIETPCISQMVREETIAKRICSPTSITMLLNRFNEDLIVEDVAWNCFDYRYNAFGNWAYNVAFAGSLGYEAYVEYGSLESLKREIIKGYPVGVSVKYTNDIDNREYPFVKNSPLTTAGHLIVVCGFEIDESGNEYVVVNDSAGKNDEYVRLKYDIKEFTAAWSRSNYAMYIIHER